MRITRKPPTGIQGCGAIGQVGEPGVAKARSSEGGRDRVDLSEAARLRQRLRAEIGDPEQIASDKVSDLQSRIAGGEYQPERGAVADRLLGELAANLLA